MKKSLTKIQIPHSLQATTYCSNDLFCCSLKCLCTVWLKRSACCLVNNNHWPVKWRALQLFTKDYCMSQGVHHQPTGWQKRRNCCLLEHDNSLVWVIIQTGIQYLVTQESKIDPNPKLSYSFLLDCIQWKLMQLCALPVLYPISWDGVLGLLLRKYTGSVSCSVPAWQSARPWTVSMVYSRKYLLLYKVAIQE